jgi:hypothetical protein
MLFPDPRYPGNFLGPGDFPIFPPPLIFTKFNLKKPYRLNIVYMVYLYIGPRGTWRHLRVGPRGHITPEAPYSTLGGYILLGLLGREYYI